MTDVNLSIIIPIYNKAEYLSNCLDSIQKSTYPHYEVWLIDDGSTDGSGGIAEEYTQKDGRFHVIHQSNKGVSAARNAGIDAAHGPWIIFVDADDYIGATYLQILTENATPGGVTIFNFHAIRKGQTSPVSVSDCNRVYTTQHPSVGSATLPYNQLLGKERNSLIVIYSKIYDLGIIRKHRIRFDTNFSRGEDILFNQTFARYASVVKVNHTCIEYYYVQDHSYLDKNFRLSGTTVYFDKMRALQEEFYKEYGLSAQMNYPFYICILDEIETIFRVQQSFSVIDYLRRVRQAHGDIIASHYHPTTPFLKLYKFLLMHHVYLFYLMKQLQLLKQTIKIRR